MSPPNHLYYGDNLTILRERIPDESVDLIYLDPPFNSNRSYNVLFKSAGGAEAAAQIEAFDDTWHWSQQTAAQFDELIGGGAPIKVADAIAAMRHLLGTNDVLAYLVMMTARLVELHRVLKPTGSLYLHCDPTASHYLKVVLDAIFGPAQFVNEIVWQRYGSHNDQGQGSQHFGRVHDTLLLYRRGEGTWHQPFGGYDPAYVEQSYRYDDGDGRGPYMTKPLTAPGGEAKGNPTYEWKGHTRSWRYSKDRMTELDNDSRLHYSKTGYVRQKHYLAEAKGTPVQDIWSDIPALAGQHAERLGYPTQKPVALLERIIEASSNEGDVVLDPFCGCGTAVDAAQKLRRRWIGIDITYLAIDLIRKRLRHTYGDGIEAAYTVYGVPADVAGAEALFAENPFDFERWAVSLIDAQPNEKQVADKGIDGRVRFYADKDRIGQVLVSVKGGKTINPAMVNEVIGTVSRDGAEMGVLITLAEPTKGMRDTAAKSGSYESTLTGQSYPRVQIVTIAELLAGTMPKMPTAILPYLKAQPRNPDQLSLD